MFGFAQARPQALTPAEVRDLRRLYCGVCQALRRDYGKWAAVLTNMDARFLALVTAAQVFAPAPVERTQCPLPPFAGIVAAGYGDPTQFAAAVTLCLVRHKLVDDLHDGESPAAALLLKAMARPFAQADQYLRAAGFPLAELDECKLAQQDLENSTRRLPLRQALEPSALAMSQILAFTADLAGAPDNREPLARIGAGVGRLVCLLDACQDYWGDRRRGRFNPILLSQESALSMSLPLYREVVDLVAEVLEGIQAELDGLVLGHDRRLVENTLTLGIAEQARRVLHRMPRQLGWPTSEVEKARACLSCVPDTDVCDPGWGVRGARVPAWKRWLVRQEIRLRSGRLAAAMEPLWSGFRLNDAAQLSGLTAMSSGLLMSSLVWAPLLAQQDDCSTGLAEGCACGGVGIGELASCLNVSPETMLCCCCCMAGSDNDCCD